MDDGSGKFQSKLLQAVGDRLGDQVGMSGSPPNDTAERNDAVGFLFFEESLGNDGDFKSAGNADEIDSGSSGIELNFLNSILDESVGEFGIKFGRYNGDPNLAPGEGPRFWWNDGRHAGAGMIGRRVFVN